MIFGFKKEKRKRVFVELMIIIYIKIIIYQGYIKQKTQQKHEKKEKTVRKKERIQ